MSNPRKTYPRPLADFAGLCLSETFAKQGFASIDLVTHWSDIAGQEIASACQPVKLQWPRGEGRSETETATLILRVDGPEAIEIQHQSGLIIERVNRFFGWRAVGKIALRQAPLGRPEKKSAARKPDPKEKQKIANDLSSVRDDALRDALAELGAAIKMR